MATTSPTPEAGDEPTSPTEPQPKPIPSSTSTSPKRRPIRPPRGTPVENKTPAARPRALSESDRPDSASDNDHNGIHSEDDDDVEDISVAYSDSDSYPPPRYSPPRYRATHPPKKRYSVMKRERDKAAFEAQQEQMQMQLQQQSQQVAPAQEKAKLRVQLVMNLEIEIELKVAIAGDLTLTLF